MATHRLVPQEPQRTERARMSLPTPEQQPPITDPPLPPATPAPRPPTTEPPLQPFPEQPRPLTPADAVAQAHADLAKMPHDARAYVRYLSIYSVPAAERAKTIQALSGHVNGLSRGTDLVLYGFIVCFMVFMASSAQRHRHMEESLTRLARRVALG